jgi:hypothetical protein
MNKISLVETILNEMFGDSPGCDTKKPKTVESISKKHGVSSATIQKQLNSGIKIEMEHTTDAGEAETIALHHLDEIPDYYTRLKKMEKKSEMKESKKDKDPCWTGYEKRGLKKKGKKTVPNCVPINEVLSRMPKQSGRLYSVLLSWRNKNIHVQLFFPQLNTPQRSDIVYAIEKIYPGSKIIKYVPTQIDPNAPIIYYPENKLREGWERVNRNDGVDGMSQKAVDQYKKENPGSNLKKAVTEKNPSGRRKTRQNSYCSRSKGQQSMHNIDCSKTPDKPICKARKRWNCSN